MYVIHSNCLIIIRYCYETNDGSLVIPWSVADLQLHGTNFVTLLLLKGIPSGKSWMVYFMFFFAQLAFAAYLPGVAIHGLPINKAGKRLLYYCNGYVSYYVVLLSLLLLQYYGLFDLAHIADNLGEYLIAGIVIGNVSSIYWYLYGVFTEPPTTRTKNIIYDFFMGTALYPRIGFFPFGHEIDIKMVAEIRWSWLTLMCLTLSCAVKQYQTLGYITKEMGVMLLAHWLYSNATVKGEHYIPATWDMFHERFGWMLNFWNTSGVPFLYCFQSFYILKRGIELDAQLSVPYIVFVYIFLIFGYYIFDAANCQKASIKFTVISRRLFPDVPWGVLKSPVRFLDTPKGKLLVDGFYAFARKMQYTGDIMMGLSWGLACGFGSFMPYFYVTFFFLMICHRQMRDEVRCRIKYGDFWVYYTSLVPNVFVPSYDFIRFLFDKNFKLAPIVLPPHLQAQLDASRSSSSLRTSARIASPAPASAPASATKRKSLGESVASKPAATRATTPSKKASASGKSAKTTAWRDVPTPVSTRSKSPRKRAGKVN